MNRRPYFSRVHTFAWKDKAGDLTPGIALRQGHRITAHLNETEAIDLANRLVDLAETLETPDEPQTN